MAKSVIKTVTLKDISFNEGVSKSGRAYTMVFVTVGEKKASMYCDSVYGKSKLEKAKEWNPGTKVSLKFEQSGEYLNFDIPNRTDLLDERVVALEEKVKALEDAQKAK